MAKRKDDRFESAAEQSSDASIWLCSDKVEWAQARRAAAYRNVVESDADSSKGRVERSAYVIGGVVGVGVWCCGVAPVLACALAGGAAGMVFLTALVVEMTAERESFQAAARAGVAWRRAVEERGGSVDEAFLARIPGHTACLASRAARLALSGSSEEVSLRPVSAFGSLCLFFAAGCSRVFGGKTGGWAKLMAAEKVDHEELAWALLPAVVAQRESDEIRSAVGNDMGGEALRKAGPRRM